MKTYNISGSSDKKLDYLPPDSILSVSGSADVIIKGNVGKNSTVSVSRSGDVSIMGRVEEGTRISVSGSGDVIIGSEVEDNVRVMVSGCGGITFKQRPPESVINQIMVNGNGKVKMPGGFQKSNKQYNKSKSFFGDDITGLTTSISDLTINSGIFITNGCKLSAKSDDGLVTVERNGVTTIYSGKFISMIGNQVYIDGRLAIENDDRIISRSNDVLHSPPQSTTSNLFQQFSHAQQEPLAKVSHASFQTNNDAAANTSAIPLPANNNLLTNSVYQTEPSSEDSPVTTMDNVFSSNFRK